MRKLVSVRKIKDIKPIKDADLIELAIVDGWQCVVKKGEFKKGDLGIYFEIDSFLPVVEEFEFLKKSCLKKMDEKEGIRIKTIKLRGELSQGLVLTYQQLERFFTENPFNVSNKPKFELEEDLTELIGVEKYEAPIPAQLSGDVVGVFPSFIEKSDQERIQNLFDKYTQKYLDNNEEIIEKLTQLGGYEQRIEELKNNRIINPIIDLEFEATTKLDGSSMTCFVVNPHKYSTKNIVKELEKNNNMNVYFGVCSKNLELKENENNTYWKVANRDIKEKLIQFFEETGRNIALQGELMGEGIQGNREKIKGQEFFCYNIWDIDKQRFLTKDERKEILINLKIKEVPFLETLKVFVKFKNVEEILKYAEGKSLNHDIREGVVFKSTTLVNGKTISFKAISNKYLLKYD